MSEECPHQTLKAESAKGQLVTCRLVDDALPWSCLFGRHMCTVCIKQGPPSPPENKSDSVVSKIYRAALVTAMRSSVSDEMFAKRYKTTRRELIDRCRSIGRTDEQNAQDLASAVKTRGSEFTQDDGLKLGTGAGLFDDIKPISDTDGAQAARDTSAD